VIYGFVEVMHSGYLDGWILDNENDELMAMIMGIAVFLSRHFAGLFRFKTAAVSRS
jgi:hypothetical protein